MALASRFRHRAVLAPPPRSSAFAEAILTLTRTGEFDLVLPVGYASHLELSRRKPEICESAKLEIADHQDIRRAGNKSEIRTIASQIGIPVPATYYPTDLDTALNHPFDYPVIVKATVESPGVTVRRASCVEELRAACTQLANIDPGCAFPMIQEYIPGYGCGFFALYQHGVCKRIFMHRRVREYPPSGGASSCAQSFYDPQLKSYGISLLDALKWHGVAMVEFRYDTRDHRYKLLEVNPKFWGSLDLALASGVDFPYYVCKMASGKAVDYSEDYDRDIKFHWPFSGELQLCLRHPRFTMAVLADCLNPCVQSNLWFSDLRPNLKEAAVALRAGVNKLWPA